MSTELSRMALTLHAAVPPQRHSAPSALCHTSADQATAGARHPFDARIVELFHALPRPDDPRTCILISEHLRAELQPVVRPVVAVRGRRPGEVQIPLGERTGNGHAVHRRCRRARTS